MAVVAGGRDINAAERRLAVHAALVQFDGLAVQHFVFGGEVEVFVAMPAGFRKMHRVHPRLLLP